MIYVGIDDTDIVGTPGTNQLARYLARELAAQFHCALIVRHQLLEDPRVPCTSKNGCGALVLEPRAAYSTSELANRLRELILEWIPDGSDPGLCLTEVVPEQIVAWGLRCQRELVTQAEARRLAGLMGIYLVGLAGTEDGVIGALAAVGLTAARNSGRVVHLGSSADDFYDVTGWQTVQSLHARGIERIACEASARPVTEGLVDVGKRLRPNLTAGEIVLFVGPAVDEAGEWRAIRKV